MPRRLSGLIMNNSVRFSCALYCSNDTSFRMNGFDVSGSWEVGLWKSLSHGGMRRLPSGDFISYSWGRNSHYTNDGGYNIN